MKRRVDRWRRRFGFDANDLRRDVDRTQWRAGLVLLVMFLVVAPPLTATVAGGVYDSGVRAERRDAATWNRVDATIVETGVLRVGHRVTVTWTDPDGTRRTGEFTALNRVRVGDTVPAWAGHGTVSGTLPSRHGRTVIGTTAAATGTVLAVGSPLLGLYALVRRRCDRRRDRLWDAAWARLDNHRIGP
jgi:hypothetical protein